MIFGPAAIHKYAIENLNAVRTGGTLPLMPLHFRALAARGFFFEERPKIFFKQLPI